MRFFRVKSQLGPAELCEALGKLDAVAVRIGVAASEDEFELAAHLAERSFAEKTNIARAPQYEFLLWLAGTKDIGNAMRGLSPKEGEREFFVFVFSDAGEREILAELGATPGAGAKGEKLPLGLPKKGEPLALERISLSRTI